MADDTYWFTGKSVAEILDLHDEHGSAGLLTGLLAVMWDERKRTGREFTPEESALSAVKYLEWEVLNGGFHQFFWNSSGEFAPIIESSLRLIGCPLKADIARDALAASSVAQMPRDDVRDELDREDEERDAKLRACDDRYFENPEDVQGRAVAYIRAHPEKFPY